MYQHNEETGKPILNETRHMILREDFYMDRLNCDPMTFDTECKLLNRK